MIKVGGRGVNAKNLPRLTHSSCIFYEFTST